MCRSLFFCSSKWPKPLIIKSLCTRLQCRNVLGSAWILQNSFVLVQNKRLNKCHPGSKSSNIFHEFMQHFQVLLFVFGKMWQPLESSDLKAHFVVKIRNHQKLLSPHICPYWSKFICKLWETLLSYSQGVSKDLYKLQSSLTIPLQKVWDGIFVNMLWLYLILCLCIFLHARTQVGIFFHTSDLHTWCPITEYQCD